MHHPSLGAFSTLPLETQLLGLQYAAIPQHLNLTRTTLTPPTARNLNASSSNISNITNNSDPESINSRIFVGNLNTFIITKDDVETIFKRYGKLQGISMHKGYAFIQYTCEQDARNAVKAEDQRVYATQAIDVNMTAEPKPNRPSRKRSHSMVAKSVYNPVDGSFHVPAVKFPHLQVIPPVLTSVNKPANSMTDTSHVISHVISGNAVKEELGGEKSGGDILICGKCKEHFTSITSLTQHKQQGCASQLEQQTCNCTEGVESLVCATCRAGFASSAELAKHCQKQHLIPIFIDTSNEKDEEISVSGNHPSSTILAHASLQQEHHETLDDANGAK